MQQLILGVLFSAILFSGCATTNRVPLKVESEPGDALISIHDTNGASPENIRKVAGVTPIERNFDFPKETNRLWVEIEKRGYVPQRLEITPYSKTLSVKLERMKDAKGEFVKEFSFPPIKRLLLVAPEVEVIKRGFASEAVAKDESATARDALARATEAFFLNKYEVVSVPSSQDNTQ